MQKAMRVWEGTAKLTTVEIFIQYVNSRFATRPTMDGHRCSPNLGHFYQIGMDIQATPAECLEIEKAFRPGWKAVKVVYWHGRLSIHLDCNENSGLTSFYNGKPLSSCLQSANANNEQAA